VLPEDIPELKAIGVREAFTPGTDMSEIVDRVQYLFETSG